MNPLLILASPPEHPSTTDFWGKLKNCLSVHDRISVYCLHEGAQSLADVRLKNQKIRLFACPRAAEAFGGSGWEGVTLGGPGLLAELIERASPIHPFSPG